MKIFIPETEENGLVFIGGDDARHIFAHRPQPGDIVECSDGKNFTYTGKIDKIQRDGLFIKAEKRAPITKRETEITLFQAFLKSDKNEFVIQKATELGADRIVFFSSENCVMKLDLQKEKAKKARFEKIALQAAMQCGRDTVPEISDFTNFTGAVEKASKKNGMFFYENAADEGFPLLSEHLAKTELKDSISFIIGPEGGFSIKEADAAKSSLETLSLGKRILRAETAPLAVLSLIMAKIGEI